MEYNWCKNGSDLRREILKLQIQADSVALWYVGQMGVVLKFHNKLYCIDPVFNDLKDTSGNSRRNYPAPFPPESFTPVDYVICSHNHADHLNLETLVPLYGANKNIRFVVPLPLTGMLSAAGIPEENIIGAREKEEINLSDLHIYPIAAAHEAYETDASGNYRCLGYVLSCGKIRLYHSGDTILADKLVRDLKEYGPYDLIMLPINGSDEERRKRGVVGNMDYKDAAWLSAKLDAGLVIPMHYDMVKNNGENPQLFAEFMEHRCPGQRYRIMKLGEHIVLEK